ncbi:uncharacterized protein IAS62_005730 [Cryptococcus decagattii]|uniref:Uncharacterized protein n=1 Tax=Cryptococcus decagattii TaxID=1859122 RepID=A0ABZ2B0P8_9TREE
MPSQFSDSHWGGRRPRRQRCFCCRLESFGGTAAQRNSWDGSPFAPNPNPFPSSFLNQAAFAIKPREKSAPAPKPLVQQRDTRPAYPPCCDFGYRLLRSRPSPAPPSSTTFRRSTTKDHLPPSTGSNIFDNHLLIIATRLL